MNINFDYKNVFTKKLLLQIYFIFFIFLNIIDFLNIISGDLDFFKKILSWILIGYIFYSVSFTKIFIGYRKKNYDLMFLLGFCLITIPKSLAHYKNNVIDIIDQYIIFKFFIESLPQNLEVFVVFTFLLGLFISIITAISLVSNNKIECESLLGSFNLKEDKFESIAFRYALIVLVSIFFGTIVFNFFMEWFALAVDSLILVLGLLFYLFKFVHDHTNTKASDYLQEVSNTGNDFYKNLIGYFSNKKTFFIAVSFLLTLHTLVDAGVYIIPYSIGTQNTLYFEALDAGGVREHIPLFNFINFENSQIYKDLSKSYDSFYLTLTIVLIYMINIIFFLLLLILPFYIFYKNINNENVIFPKSLVFIFLMTIIFYITLIYIGINNPIQMSPPDSSSQVRGIDFHTNHITKGNIHPLYFALPLLLSLMIVGIVLSNLKINFPSGKVISAIVLLFFIGYISLFFYDSTKNEINSLIGNLNNENEENNRIILENSRLYQDIFNDNYDVKSFYKSTPFENEIMKVRAFSNINIRTVSANNSHDDFLLIEIKKINEKVFIELEKNLSSYYIKNPLAYDLKTKKLVDNMTLIYYFGENYFDFSNYLENREIDLRQSEWNEIFSIIEDPNKERSILVSTLQNGLGYLRLVLNSIFYIGGIIAFSIFFSRRNILN